MKRLLFFLLLTFPAFAQQFSHIILVIQENRTPDNYFSACTIPGADLVKPSGGSIPLSSTSNPSHTHPAYLSDATGVWKKSVQKYVQLSDIQSNCILASSYGFANRMFQTNQGPSFPAHQFLFTGTSAPSAPGQLYSDYFASEDTTGDCLAIKTVTLIDPSGLESVLIKPCFEHATLSDLLDNAKLSWKYYAASMSGLWNAPAAIYHVCGPMKKTCQGNDWKASDVLNPPQILNDIANGTLANVSWVTPAASYSDHSGYGTGGPAWIASIVNAVGQSSYWQNTAIIITWDDWGGWYDHVAPLANNTGWCTSYCYGFRVPLLVISAYTPPMADNQTHDFGSILHFVESNFELPFIGPGTYADSFADNLSGFFPLQTPQPFVAVSSQHDAQYFLNLHDTGDPDDD